jgi:hypothetical protein
MTLSPSPKSPLHQRDPFERDRRRLNRYRELRDFYDGVQWVGKARRGEKRLVVNYARALVRKVVSYALPDPVGFEVPPPVLAVEDVEQSSGRAVEQDGPDPRLLDSPPPDAALIRARQLAGDAQANSVETLLAELDADRLDFALAIDSAVLGDGVLKVTWDPVALRPRLAIVDPSTLLAWWSPDTPTDAYKFAQHYTLPGQVIAGLGWSHAGALQPDRLYPIVEEWTGDRWLVTVAGQTARDEPNPYGWLPYLVLPNNASGAEFWGESDLEDLLHCCRELNSRLSVLADILDYSGYPVTVLENVDGSDGIVLGPGAKWEMPEGSKAYLLDLLQGGGVRLHIDYIDELRTALHDLAETPRTAFGEAGRAIAGAALQVELQPLVQKVKRKRRGLASLYRKRNAMLLDLMERFSGAPIGGLRRTVPVWPPILPSDREAEARVGVQLVNARVRSRRSVAADLGEEDPDGEIARIVEEAERLAAMGATEAGGDEDGTTGAGGGSRQDGRDEEREDDAHPEVAEEGSAAAEEETARGRTAARTKSRAPGGSS